MPIEAIAQPLSQIFSNEYWFEIPNYQRPYKWGKEEIDDLLDDLFEAYRNHDDDTQYFLGSIVLRKKPRYTYEVLDGQQRLTTLVIILMVIGKLIVEQPREREAVLNLVYTQEARAIGIPARCRIVYSRDEANRTIQDLFFSELVENDYPESNKDVSSKNIIKAFNLIKNYLKEIVTLHGETEIINFCSFLNRQTIIINVSADTSEDAFRLFSILNNRGIPLTGADILKAENIGALPSRSAKDRGAQIWDDIENGIQDKQEKGINFDGFLQFIRAIYVKEKAPKTLLEDFENKIYRRHLLIKGQATIDAIETYYNIYDIAIKCSEMENMDDKTIVQYRQLVHIMRRYIASKDWIPPILYFYKKLQDLHDNNNFALMLDFLKKLEYKFVGDWICGEKPSARRNAMYDILKEIEQIGVTQSPRDIINNNVLFHVDDEKLKISLNNEIYEEDYAQYILLKLEYLCSTYSVFTEYKKVSIEHVLPQTPPTNSQWNDDFTEEQKGHWMHRIANLVLLSPSKNREFRNYDFTRKKQRYSTTRGIENFVVTRQTIEGTDQWTPQVLEKRQERLVNFIIANEPISIDNIQKAVKID